ncbi:tetratricopeptide repeat protein [Streptomyces sp. NPDC093252]|uniref:ATP-binding protein n=1 Tax=Streptomyces sp. NPDC093252 TaxID=3154980 RepID=UPI003420A2DB
MDDNRDVRNVVADSTAGTVVQAGTIHGGVHIHQGGGPGKAPPVIPAQLPSGIPHFVGRERELGLLLRRLEDGAGAGRAVVISSLGGTAGIGKTTLAVHWGRLHRERFPDGQLYVDLRGFAPGRAPMTADEAVRGFLDAFRVPADRIPTGLDAQTALYRTLTEGRRLLIVLDNARDSAQVRPLLPGGAGCLVLVTSRRALTGLVAREQARQLTLDLLSADEARALLTGFLGADRVTAEAGAVDQLAERCAGLPIALAIVAARAATAPALPLTALAAELDDVRDRLIALSTGDGDDTDIRAVFSWSRTALTPAAADLFTLLGLHPGPDLGLDAAASLSATRPARTRALLAELTAAHLLEEYLPGRYRCHDLLRAYAAELAATELTEPQRHDAVHRVLDFYLHTALAANRPLAPHREPLQVPPPRPGVTPLAVPGHTAAMRWFGTEHANLTAAVELAAEAGFDRHAWQLPWPFATFLDREGHWLDRAAGLRTALAAARRLGDRPAQATSHRLLGNTCARLGRYPEARAELGHALALYTRLGDRTGQAATHHGLGWAHGRAGDHAGALTHDLTALALFRETGAASGEADALTNVSRWYARLGDHEQALDHSHRALTLHRALGNRYGEAGALDTLGHAHGCLGRYDDALAAHHEALALWQALGDHHFRSVTLRSIGSLHRALGDPAGARAAWEQALTLLEALDHPDAETVRRDLAGLP